MDYIESINITEEIRSLREASTAENTLETTSQSAPHGLVETETWMWANMRNTKQRPKLLLATPETKAMHRRRLSHSLAGWKVRLHLHAAVGTFDGFHCVHDLSPEKAPQVPKLQHSVLSRGQTWQPHTKTPHTMVSRSLNTHSRFMCSLLSSLAKHIECSSLADWLTDPIVETHKHTKGETLADLIQISLLLYFSLTQFFISVWRGSRIWSCVCVGVYLSAANHPYYWTHKPNIFCANLWLCSRT